MKKYAVIVAGGKGSRMGSSLPKQFLNLMGKPVIWYTLEAFLGAFSDVQILLVVPEDFLTEGEQIVCETSSPERIRLAFGGAARFYSVQNGLKYIKEQSVIFVHDGVRCLVSESLIRRCYHQALEKGSAIPAVTVSDSVRIREGEKTKVVDRSKLLAVQTPQTFRSEIILPAFQQPFSEAFTDEATVVEAAGHEVYIIEGEKENIKITLPADLAMAEQLLKTAHPGLFL